jgi:hypothetical protein
MWPKLSSNISLPLTTLTLIILFSEILKILNFIFQIKKMWKELLNFQEYSIYRNENFKINSNDNDSWN